MKNFVGDFLFAKKQKYKILKEKNEVKIIKTSGGIKIEEIISNDVAIADILGNG